MSQIKVMLFGTFDGLHTGHITYIKEAHKLGQILIIVIARDINVIKTKNRQPLYNEKTRLKAVQSQFNFAKVVLGDKNDFYKPIKTHKPNIIALGYDQKADLNYLKQHFPQIKINRLSAFHPHKYKSSLLNVKKNVTSFK